MRWMKIDGACRHAGDSSRKTLYAAVKAGKLRVARVGAGRNFLFCEEWIDDYLKGEAENTSPTNGASRRG